MANPGTPATPADIQPFDKYPVNVIIATSNTTINIFCDTFRPTQAQEWQLKASAAIISILPGGRTNALLIGQGHHPSMYSPTEADHLTLLPFDEKHEKIRADLTAHVYVSSPETPWLGEWFKKSGPKRSGPTFVSRFTSATEKPLTTLDLTSSGLAAPGLKPEFLQLQFQKPIPDPARRASIPHGPQATTPLPPIGSTHLTRACANLKRSDTGEFLVDDV